MSDRRRRPLRIGQTRPLLCNVGNLEAGTLVVLGFPGRFDRDKPATCCWSCTVTGNHKTYHVPAWALMRRDTP